MGEVDVTNAEKADIVSGKTLLATCIDKVLVHVEGIHDYDSDDSTISTCIA